MLHTPLALGQIIHPPEDAYDRVWLLVEKNNKENLARGLLCEYAHNHQFQLAGWAYETTITTGIYDRVYNRLKQDDKLSTLNGNGELSTTHTISQAEYFLWQKEDDVIIHSFEEVDDGRNGSCYRGSISFRKLRAAELIQPSKYDQSHFFNRLTALKHARA